MEGSRKSGDDGATPLGPEEFEELIPEWIINRDELNRAESQGILAARIRHFSQRLEAEKILDDLFLRNLHRDMFGSVWTWAGKYRARQLNLGIDHSQIATSVRALLDSVGYRLADGQDLDIVTADLHHKLVSIHPFINGNGRHGRLYVDLLRNSLGLKPFNWGGNSDENAKETRSTYLKALRAADGGDLSELLAFVLS
jgi:Fic-DOC domain mobile mystery protein B